MEELKLLMRDDYEELARLIDQADHFLQSRSVPPKGIYITTLVLEEILTNIVKYAFDENGQHDITVLMKLQQDDLLIEFVDAGREFDPLSAPSPVLADSILDCDEGGLGIHLVRKSVESMEYRRDGEKNVLSVKIDLRPESENG